MSAYLLYAALAAFWIALIRSEPAIPIRPRSRRSVVALATLVLLAIVTAAAILAVTRGRALHDFDKAYYPAGAAILHDPSALYLCPDEAQCFVNVPIVAAAFIPLSSVTPAVAHAVMAILSVISVIGLIVAISKLTGTGSRVSTVVAALVLLNGPLYYSVRLGNTTHMVALALVAAMLLDRRGRAFQAGVLIGLAALMKPVLIVFGPYFALRKQGRALSGLAAALGTAIVLSVAFFGLDVHREWIHQVVIASGRGPIAAYNSQSIGAALARLLLDKGYLWTWTPLDVNPSFKTIQTVVIFGFVAAILLASAAVRPRDARDATPVEWFLVIGVALGVGPITWTHYYLLLLPALAWLAIVEPPATRAGRAILAAGALLVSAPVVLAIPTTPDAVAALFERVLLSHYVGGLFVLMAAVVACQWRRSRPIEHEAHLAATA